MTVSALPVQVVQPQLPLLQRLRAMTAGKLAPAGTAAGAVAAAAVASPSKVRYICQVQITVHMFMRLHCQVID